MTEKHNSQIHRGKLELDLSQITHFPQPKFQTPLSSLASIKSLCAICRVSPLFMKSQVSQSTCFSLKQHVVNAHLFFSPTSWTRSALEIYLQDDAQKLRSAMHESYHLGKAPSPFSGRVSRTIVAPSARVASHQIRWIRWSGEDNLQCLRYHMA